ncbi:MAG: hypothetical protein ACR2PI_07460 [Hyphomicrobiaceae bacterium]
MYKRLIGAALVFGMAATPPPAAAQTHLRCADRASIVGTLEKKHRESAIGIGLSGPQAVFEVWRAKRSGTWTITVTRPNNTTCIVAAGSNWLEAGPEAPKSVRHAAAKR